MSPEELEKYSYYLAAGASAAQAADMARGVITGKGQSWLPNKLASSAKGIPNPSTASWWKSGKVPFGLRGTFMGAAPTTGATLGLAGLAGTAGFMGANAFMDTNFADNIGLGRNDFKDYGSNLFDFVNSNKVQTGMDTLNNIAKVVSPGYGVTSQLIKKFNKGTIDPSEFVRPTPAQTNQALSMDSQLAQAQAGNRQTPTTVSPTPPLPSQRNETKFSPTRSTAIKGGRGGRGNVSQRRKTSSPSPVFKSYGPPNRQRY